MKFLHTADWHLGRGVRGRSRDEEHRQALAQVLAYAREHRVDCVLVAGDLFDTTTPPPEAERTAFEFFRDLYGAGIPAVVLAGNHDHPRRIEALAPLLGALNIRAIGRPVGPDEGGVVEIPSRDGRETAQIAVLPWVPDRDAVEFATLGGGAAEALTQYAEGIRRALDQLTGSFRPDRVAVLAAHCFIDEATVGPDGGERPLSVSLGIYGLPLRMLPVAPQYTALGHVHRPQALRPSPAAWYSGSLLQLDFGEQRQEKFVNLVEVHPGKPATVHQLPITAGRALLDVGRPDRGARLDELPAWADRVGDAWLRVYVEHDAPLANLPARVREQLPNAVHVERVRREATAAETAPTQGLSAEELFRAFYRSPQGRGQEPTEETVALFRELLQQAQAAESAADGR